jgi:hypothetical protein
MKKLVFPAVAAFVKDTKAWPKWWGVLDVTLALDRLGGLFVAHLNSPRLVRFFFLNPTI